MATPARFSLLHRCSADRRRSRARSHPPVLPPGPVRGLRNAAAQRPPRRPDGDRRARAASPSSRSRSPRPTCSATASGSTISIIATASSGRCRRTWRASSRRSAIFPGEAGLIVADRYDAAVVREAAHRPLAPARRKAELLRFARRAARRLSAQVDPSLGDADLAAAGFGFLASISLQDVAGARVALRHSRAPNSPRRYRSCPDRRRRRAASRTIGVWRCWTAMISGVSPILLVRVDLGAQAEQPFDRLLEARPAPRRSAACRRPCRARLGSAPLLSRKPVHCSSLRLIAMISAVSPSPSLRVDDAVGIVASRSWSPCRRRSS